VPAAAGMADDEGVAVDETRLGVAIHAEDTSLVHNGQDPQNESITVAETRFGVGLRAEDTRLVRSRRDPQTLKVTVDVDLGTLRRLQPTLTPWTGRKVVCATCRGASLLLTSNATCRATCGIGEDRHELSGFRV